MSDQSREDRGDGPGGITTGEAPCPSAPVAGGRASRACAALVLLGLVLSLAAWPGMRSVSRDSLHYLQGATSLREGRYLDPQGEPQLLFPPGYPALIALGMTFGGDPELVGRIVSLLAATVALPLVFLLVRRLGSDALALAATGLFALMPERVSQSNMVWSEAGFLCLSLLTILLAWNWLDTGRPAWALSAGVVAGAACLVRPEGAAILLVAIAVGLIGTRLSPRMLLGAALAVAALLLAVFPYVRFLHEHTGRWQLSTKLEVNLDNADRVSYGGPSWKWRRFSEDGEVVSTDRRQGPLRALARAVYNEFGMLASLTMICGPVLFAFAGVGMLELLLGRCYRNRGPGVLAAMLILAAPMLYLPVLHWEDRYLILPALLAVVAGTAGAARAVELVSARSRRRLTWALVALFVLPLLALNGEYFFRLKPDPNAVGRQRGGWIATHLPGESILITNQPHVAYHAGLWHRSLPYGTIEQVARYARSEGAELLLLPKENHHPSLCAYALSPGGVEGLEPLKDWGDALLVRVHRRAADRPGSH